MNDLELPVERHRHDMQRAWHFASGLINQNLALHLPPSEPFVISAHPIDAKEEPNIHLPLVTKKIRCVLYQNCGVTMALSGGNSHHSADTADEHGLAIRPRAMFEYAGMTHGCVWSRVQDKMYLIAGLRTVGELQVGYAKYVIAPSPELV
jgi:hypothetical protein